MEQIRRREIERDGVWRDRGVKRERKKCGGGGFARGSV